MKDPKQIILTYTPTLFSSVIIHAACKGNLIMYSLMTGLMITSLILHGKWYDEYPGKKLVRDLDILFAHITVGYTLFLNLYNPLTSIWTWITYVSIGYIITIYHFEIKPYSYMRPYLHATMHIIGALGSNTVLI
jgi:hypothetical protein